MSRSINIILLLKLTHHKQGNAVKLYYTVSADLIPVCKHELCTISHTDTDTQPSLCMPENWRVPEGCENLDSDVEIIDDKNAVISPLPDAPKGRGNLLSRCLKNRKVARKIQFEKENIPVSMSSSNVMPIKPGAADVQFPRHTYTPDLQPRVLQRRNYGSAQNQPQRANAAVRTPPLSPIRVVDREESYAAPKHPGNPSPKIPHQKYKNVSRERSASQSVSPFITQEANSILSSPQVTPENREITQLVADLWRVCRIHS
ncbi:uncharacterized protein LOC143793871 [Ranitomeya variabilis]|uniref:uncharacterized protein LOC143793871 n=1 Tax=Ranitomeya variabilis TaxID=490064 RepID=UPI00405662F4